MKKIIFCFFLFLSAPSLPAQILPGSATIPIDTIVMQLQVEDKAYVFIDSLGHIPLDQVLQQRFVPLSSFSKKEDIPPRLVPKPAYLAIQLQNNSLETRNIYYFVGGLYTDMKVYQLTEAGSLQAQPGAVRKSSFVLLTLPPGATNTYLVQLEFCKMTFNNMRSTLISPSFYPYYRGSVAETSGERRMVGLILSGVLLMMSMFTLANYFISRRVEFLSNCIYSVCNFFLIFFTSYLSKNAGRFNAFFYGYLDLLLLIGGTMAYLAFTRKFLSTKTLFPNLNRFLVAEEWTLGILMGLYSFLHFFTDYFAWETQLENILKWIILLAGVVYIIVSLKQKYKLMYYLAIGTSVQLLFSAVSFVIILTKINSRNFISSPFFYFEIGVVVSVIFFILGLIYKNRTELIEKVKEQEAMKLEVEKKSFETQLAVMNAQQEERNRISADMHDDLGAGMTTIRLYSELAKNRIGSTVIPEIEKISASANELLNKMNAIIWSMSSSNDTLGNMVAYIRSYAQEYFEDSNIKCKIQIPDRLPEMQVSGEIRRNVFLVVKEALHNVVKHANATEVDIILEKKPLGILLTIHDNGKGVDLDNVRKFGNGLKNMRKRMEDIGVDFSIENHAGTSIRLYKQTRDQ